MSKNNSGYITLVRSIQDNWIYHHDAQFSWFQAWIDLIFLVNHADGKTVIGHDIKVIHRGQRHTSISQLSKRWGWCRETVTEFLDLLQKNGSIKYVPTANGTLITIENYDFYQSPWHKELATDPTTDPTADLATDLATHPTQTIQNKYRKNTKNEKASPEAPLIRRGITYE